MRGSSPTQDILADARNYIGSTATRTAHGLDPPTPLIIPRGTQSAHTTPTLSKTPVHSGSYLQQFERKKRKEDKRKQQQHRRHNHQRPTSDHQNSVVNVKAWTTSPAGSSTSSKSKSKSRSKTTGAGLGGGGEGGGGGGGEGRGGGAGPLSRHHRDVNVQQRLAEDTGSSNSPSQHHGGMLPAQHMNGGGKHRRSPTPPAGVGGRKTPPMGRRTPDKSSLPLEHPDRHRRMNSGEPQGTGNGEQLKNSTSPTKYKQPYPTTRSLHLQRRPAHKRTASTGTANGGSGLVSGSGGSPLVKVRHRVTKSIGGATSSTLNMMQAGNDLYATTSPDAEGHRKRTMRIDNGGSTAAGGGIRNRSEVTASAAEAENKQDVQTTTPKTNSQDDMGGMNSLYGKRRYQRWKQDKLGGERKRPTPLDTLTTETARTHRSGDNVVVGPPSDKTTTPTKSATNLMNFVQAEPGSPFAAAAAAAKAAEAEANSPSSMSSEEPMKMAMSDLSTAASSSNLNGGAEDNNMGGIGGGNGDSRAE